MSDLILTNANVVTMDPGFPRAQLIAIREGKILSLGKNEDLRRFKKEKTEVIDAGGKTILPGFIDAHCHLPAFAESLVALSLRPEKNIRSISDVQSAISQAARDSAPGTWIRGMGYDEFHLSEKRHPFRRDLDKATALHPVKLTHRSGLAHVLNSLALELTGISKETADPPEGLIDRDLETGEPTGVLYGMNEHLARTVPPLDRNVLNRGIGMASRQLSSLGVTSIQDASARNDFERWEMFQKWVEEGLLRQRVSLILGYAGFKSYRKQPFASSIAADRLRVGGVKIIVHETTGRLSPTQEELNGMIQEVHEAGLQAVVHAIEGKAIEAACDAIEHAQRTSPRSDHRHRIEHCSVCPEPLARRIASRNIRVVTQPSFIYYNGERYLRTVPEANLKHLYPIATLMKSGIKVAGSSDSPVVPANPLIGIYAAVSRRAENGELVVPEERISAFEALRMCTDCAAEASFEETIKGSIAPGKLADLAVLSADPFELPVDGLKDIKVEMTILNGKIVWDASVVKVGI